MAGHDGYTRYTIRVPDALYARIKKAAGEKSVNAEIVGMLEQAYPPPLDEALFIALEAIELIKAAIEQGDEFKEPGGLHHQAALKLISALDVKLDVDSTVQNVVEKIPRRPPSPDGTPDD
jgi:hypothetical protein